MAPIQGGSNSPRAANSLGDSNDSNTIPTSSSKLSRGATIGVIISVVFFVVLVGYCGLRAYTASKRRRVERAEQESQKSIELRTVMNAAPVSRSAEEYVVDPPPIYSPKTNKATDVPVNEVDSPAYTPPSGLSSTGSRVTAS